MGILHKHDDGELAGLRAAYAKALADAQRREREQAEAQRRADETGWCPDGRYTRPGRAARDRLARGGS